MQFVERLARRRGSARYAPMTLHAHVVAAQFGEFVMREIHAQIEQRGYLRRVAPPVLRGETVDGHYRDARGRWRRGYAARSATMPRRCPSIAGKLLLLRPAAVAVHDDGDVARQRARDRAWSASSGMTPAIVTIARLVRLVPANAVRCGPRNPARRRMRTHAKNAKHAAAGISADRRENRATRARDRAAPAARRFRPSVQNLRAWQGVSLRPP